MFWEAIEFLDVMEEESGYSFYCDHCVHWNKVHSFGDRVHDSHNSVMSGELQEFDHKINTEYVPPFIWNGEWLELANRKVSPRFCPEAEVTGTHILADVPRHLRSPVILGHCHIPEI